jgi:hypothetical protein
MFAPIIRGNGSFKGGHLQLAWSISLDSACTVVPVAGTHIYLAVPEPPVHVLILILRVTGESSCYKALYHYTDRLLSGRTQLPLLYS